MTLRAGPSMSASRETPEQVREETPALPAKRPQEQTIRHPVYMFHLVRISYRNKSRPFLKPKQRTARTMCP